MKKECIEFFHGNQQEIENERTRKRTLISYFPKSMGTIDETRYVLQNDEKVKLKEHIESKSTKLSTVDITNDTAANIHETNGLNSQKPKAHQHTPIKDNLDFGNNQNEFNFDPWEREDRYNNYRNNVAEDHSQIKNYAGWINRLNKVAEIVGSGLRFDNKY